MIHRSFTARNNDAIFLFDICQRSKGVWYYMYSIKMANQFMAIYLDCIVKTVGLENTPSCRCFYEQPGVVFRYHNGSCPKIAPVPKITTAPTYIASRRYLKYQPDIIRITCNTNFSQWFSLTRWECIFIFHGAFAIFLRQNKSVKIQRVFFKI